MTRMTSIQARGTETDENAALNYSWAASEVLAGWHSDVFYIRPDELVLDIPIAPEVSGRGSESRSFASLVRKQARPTASVEIVLDELLKSGAVQNLRNGFVLCVARTYIAERFSPENIQAFAKAIHNVTRTMAVNLKRTVRGTGLL